MIFRFCFWLAGQGHPEFALRLLDIARDWWDYQDQVRDDFAGVLREIADVFSEPQIYLIITCVYMFSVMLALIFALTFPRPLP